MGHSALSRPPSRAFDTADPEFVRDPWPRYEEIRSRTRSRRGDDRQALHLRPCGRGRRRVRAILEILANEIRQTLTLMGVASLADLTRDDLLPAK